MFVTHTDECYDQNMFWQFHATVIPQSLLQIHCTLSSSILDKTDCFEVKKYPFN